ncbi:MAG: FIST N-terminal domain-containing protein [Verrucomicrobiae bacterium]
MEQAFSISIRGAYRPEAVADAARAIRGALGRPAGIAVAFASPDYLPFLQEFAETIRVDGHVSDIIGCTAGGLMEGAREMGEGSGCVVMAVACDAAEPVLPDADGLFQGPVAGRPHGGVLLANPFTFSADDWLCGWNREFPGVPCVGGLASGGNADQTAVFYNGRIVDAVCLPVCGTTGILPLVSQGCRPIGEPLTVTRAERNIVYSLGSQPAYQALESAFEALSDSEKSFAKGNLFAGLAGTEYVEDFKPGDFLIRNILGADPGSGAVAIGGIPRTGQTLQYQLRDRAIAQADLSRVLAAADLDGRRPFGALLFSCLGRGKGFFGEPHYDAARFHSSIGGKPLAGFFCNGEIGPVAGRNAVHGYTAAAAIWVEKKS